VNYIAVQDMQNPVCDSKPTLSQHALPSALLAVLMLINQPQVAADSTRSSRAGTCIIAREVGMCQRLEQLR